MASSDEPAARTGHGYPRNPPLALCYHKVERRHELGVTRLSPRRFARQMERLARAGWRAIGLEDWLASVRGARQPDGRELVITFDDAYRGLRDHAFPVLEDLGWPSLCFVITDYAGRLNRWDVAYGGRRFAHLAWRDIRRWEGRGVSFGAHTARHPRLTWVASSELERELHDARQALAAGCDEPATVVSYPFGAAGTREKRAAREAGYEAGVVLAERWRGDPFAIPRLPVYIWSPRMPGAGWMRPLEWRFARAANRFAVGTTLLQRSGAEPIARLPKQTS
ncbi:MAG TPA: polysaccharide deacetylase family protein [Gemmatimonadaceae bacterium]|nr:polysaccharide deacetylase family protein [Gemmatimonadaceae bacterium]